MDYGNLPNTTLPDFANAWGFTIAPNMIWLFFGAVALVVILISIVLLYHWIRYTFNPVKTTFVTTIYFVGVGALLLGMFFCLSYYHLTVTM